MPEHCPAESVSSLFPMHCRVVMQGCDGTRSVPRGGAALMVTRIERGNSTRGPSVHVEKHLSRLININGTLRYIEDLDIAFPAAFISGLHSSVLPLLVRFRKIEKIQARVTPPAAKFTCMWEGLFHGPRLLCDAPHVIFRSRRTY